jgi:hypothetical protein
MSTKLPTFDDSELYSGGGDGCSWCSPIEYLEIGVALLVGLMMLTFMIGYVVVLVQRCLCKGGDNHHQHIPSIEEVAALGGQELVLLPVETTDPTTISIATTTTSSSSTTTEASERKIIIHR